MLKVFCDSRGPPPRWGGGSTRGAGEGTDFLGASFRGREGIDFLEISCRGGDASIFLETSCRGGEASIFLETSGRGGEASIFLGALIVGRRKGIAEAFEGEAIRWTVVWDSGVTGRGAERVELGSGEAEDFATRGVVRTGLRTGLRIGDRLSSNRTFEAFLNS